MTQMASFEGFPTNLSLPFDGSEEDKAQEEEDCKKGNRGKVIMGHSVKDENRKKVFKAFSLLLSASR